MALAAQHWHCQGARARVVNLQRRKRRGRLLAVPRTAHPSEVVAMWRQIGPSATLDAILGGLQKHGQGIGRPDAKRWDGDVYAGCEGVLAFYEAAHLDPWATR